MINKKLNKGKKESLLAQKQRLLKDLQYYKQRIDEAKLTANNKPNFNFGDESSDSDLDLPSFNINKSISDLKQHQSSLKTSVMATQELTGVEVLQSEVNLLVEVPVTSVTEQGVWKEVTAECCIDLVPFCITFYTHTPDRTFAPTSYHKLNITAVKSSNELELGKCILPAMTRPSDAIEVIRSYAAAYRSRRTTLARLADKFDNDLVMEPSPEGGIQLKCANLLEVHWMLQNKWSPITPFQHRMKFDLEYMDEKYIKTITQAHKQLSNPELSTSERTLLLATIVNTCLEARGPTQELHDSLSSDPEGHTRIKKTTLTQKDAEPNMRRKEIEKEGDKRNEMENIGTGKEVMAPPKSVPKKSKRKLESDDRKSKKLKTDDKIDENDVQDDVVGNDDRNTNIDAKTDDGIKSNDKNPNNDKDLNVVKDKTVNKKPKTKDANNEKQIAKKSKNNEQNTVFNKGKTEIKKSVAKPKNNDNNEPVDAAMKNSEHKVDKIEEKKIVKSKSNTGNTEAARVASKNKEINLKPSKDDKTNKNVANTKNAEDNVINPKPNKVDKTNKNVANSKNVEDNNIPRKKAKVATENIAKKNKTEAKKSVASSTDTVKNQKQVINKNENPVKMTAKVASSNKTDEIVNKNNDNPAKTTKTPKIKNTENKTDTIQNKNTNDKAKQNVATEKSTVQTKEVNKNMKTTENIKSKTSELPTEKQANLNIEIVDQVKSKSNLKDIKNKNNLQTVKNDLNKENKDKNNQNRNLIKTIKDKDNKTNIHVNKLLNVKDKMNKASNLTNKKPVISKIPQIKSSPNLKGVVKKMPLRVSPRKRISAKSPISGLKKALSNKIITNIPRLMPKPTSKISK